MALHKVKSVYISGVGDVLPNDVPSWDFLYEASVVRNPKFNIGDRVVLPDGRVFRYGKAGAAIATSDLAVSFASAVKIGIETFAAISAKGSNEVTINEASITQDMLRGGYLIIYRNGYSTHCVRGILGNSASDVTVATLNNVVVTLDASLPYAITTNDNFEALLNPYADLRQTDFVSRASFAGMPMWTAAVGAYFWVQTWGPCWCVPQPGVAAAACVRAVYFRHDGSLDVRDNVGTGVTDQRAGFVVDYSPSGQGPPLIMLQVSP